MEPCGDGHSCPSMPSNARLVSLAATLLSGRIGRAPPQRLKPSGLISGAKALNATPQKPGEG